METAGPDPAVEERSRVFERSADYKEELTRLKAQRFYKILPSETNALTAWTLYISVCFWNILNTYARHP
ncbi:hypothetical protein ILYODFUR_021187 [Ilyodon furcidens]|uniref:Uncharacterized protein n=1 Tax=Ilyodon furcidens TaxID=33524 RepID=A0ABV0UU20_9TELE